MFVKNNPNYTAIYGFVNCETNERSRLGYEDHKFINSERVQILGGMRLLNFILGADTDCVLQFIQLRVQQAEQFSVLSR